ncbi:Uncharacterized protein GBIM_15576 [Gryllus bimaculatus]|nr:Uncharacterized protein GBIM_15576 [Gryllus bimaculatus]
MYDLCSPIGSNSLVPENRHTGPVTGKSSFLTGFGLGFLAFALKKLLLPIIIGGQIVKSVLIAMFLPSILGGLGKLVGKGVSTFASASGSSGGLSGPLSGSLGGGAGGVDDFGDFKEPGGAGYGDADAAGTDAAFANAFAYPDAPQYGVNGVSQPGNAAVANSISRYQAQSKVSQQAPPLDNFYMRHKQQDFKVFHQIPASSLLLTHYDPFYSPLLSRLDSVFTQLGYTSEACRERLVCAMYSNPARFAPYSNLVSAQLSR